MESSRGGLWGDRGEELNGRWNYADVLSKWEVLKGFQGTLHDLCISVSHSTMYRIIVLAGAGSARVDCCTSVAILGERALGRYRRAAGISFLWRDPIQHSKQAYLTSRQK